MLHFFTNRQVIFILFTKRQIEIIIKIKYNEFS